MKKLLAAGLSLSILLTGTAAVSQETEAAVVSSKTYYPNLKDAKTVQSLKNGSYKFNGVGINTTFSDVKKKLGAPAFKTLDGKMKDSLTYYGYADNKRNVVMTFGMDADGSVKVSQRKVDGLMFMVNQPLKYDSVKKSLGKYTVSQKNGPDKLVRMYGEYTMIGMEKIKGTWYVKQIFYGTDLV